MQMALSRQVARLENDVSRAELGQPSRLGDLALQATGNRLIEGWRVAGGVGLFDGVEIDPGHASPLNLRGAA
jgi:hypothetical protein